MVDTSLAVRQKIGLSPQEVVDNASIQAKLLMDIVEKTKCYQEISGKKYLQVEAWETIGAFNRVHVQTSSIVAIKDGDNTIGYLASVELLKDGEIAGAATMPCYFTENCCKGKEGDAKHKACMSAAQTFATSKAYRMNYSYVAILAGYQPLPAEEVTDDMKQPDKTEHWCKLHDTQFFMRGKMKSFAHPVEGQKDWCYEHKKTDTDPAQKSSTPEQGIEEPSAIPPRATQEQQVKLRELVKQGINLATKAQEWGWPPITKLAELSTHQAGRLIKEFEVGKGGDDM